MRFLQKLTAPKEIKILLGALEEIEYKLHNSAFRLVKGNVENTLFSQRKEFIDQIRKGTDARIIIYNLIGQISSKHCCFGPYVIFGVLDDTGKELYEIFEKAIDELVRAKWLTEAEGTNAVKVVKDAIATR